MINSKTQLLNKISDKGPWCISFAQGKYSVYQVTNENGTGSTYRVSRALYNELQEYVSTHIVIRKINFDLLKKSNSGEILKE